MKNRILIFILFCFICVNNIFSQQDKDNEFANLINTGDWFSALEYYDQNESELSEFMQLCGASLLNTFFSNEEKAIESLQVFTTKYAEALGAENLKFVFMLADNYASIHKYEEAYEIYAAVIPQIENFFPSEEIQKMKETQNTYLALIPFKDVLNRKNLISEDITIPIEIHEGGIFLNTTVNGKEKKTIFDTGASMNSISKELAEELKVKIVVENITFNQNIAGQLGLVDSMYVGSILFENVCFFISPEKNPNSAFDTSSLFDIVLGMEIIKEIEELHIDIKNNHLYIPFNKTVNPQKKNMIFLNKLPYLNAKINIKNSILLYDTGFNGEITLRKLDEEYQPYTLQAPTKVRYFTAEGVKESEYLRLTDVSLEIGNKIIFPSEVLVGSIHSNVSEQASGMIGRTLTDNFNKIKINFQKMWLLCE